MLTHGCPLPRGCERRRSSFGGQQLPARALRGSALPLPARSAAPRSASRLAVRAAAESTNGTGTPNGAAQTPFKKILACNRGEIAIRICRAGTELGLRTVAIYSPVDRNMPHRYKADESYMTGTPSMTPVACYLDTEGIIKLAKEQKVRPFSTFLHSDPLAILLCKPWGCRGHPDYL